MEKVMAKELTTLGHNTHSAKLELLAPMMSPISMGIELDPLDHLDNFDKLCGTTKINGVSEDAFKLRLFLFSLGDKAHTWEKSLSRDLITAWDECKKAFLTKFFSTSRTAKLRNEISGFHQRNLEGFGEARERFNSFISQCPHHGFNMESLLSTFYRGALPKFRSKLDTASNGFFLGRSEADALELVENMVKSDSVYSDDHDSSNRGIGGDDQNTKRELKALQEKMDLLLSNKAKQEKVNFVGDHRQEEMVMVSEVDGLEGQEELCFLNADGTRYKKEPNFQHNNYQQKPFYNNQQGGSKLGKTTLKASSPKEISLHKAKPDLLPLLHKRAEAHIVEKVEHKIVERVEIQTVKKVEGKVLQPVRHKAEKPLIGKAVTQLKEVQLEKAHVVEQSPYDKLPFPQRFLTKAQKKVISKFRKYMEDVGVKLP
ncbi:PREDICTED: uncharacterized protein LOC106344533 [Brassica oleracea var. oleracea]|uniref:uncharacterized protein LOC106344533 n=1 Tax=Brassica oleracea var. oleracea TaxID=109376 RepID=UPI0006A75249|nr:PREDICTED: uncharacterized protein LOC106344533 [Brassica oleracea var. oleracea]